MKKIVQKIVFVIIIFSTNVILAQPDPDRIPGDSNALDGPIDSNVFLLGIIAIVFAYVVFSKKAILNKN